MPVSRILGLAVLAAAALAPVPALAGKPPAGFAATPYTPPPPHPADGAIFNAATVYSPLVTGGLAHGVGDTLTIILSEVTTASKTSNTKTQRSGNASITPPTAGPFAINPNALSAGSQGTFSGAGNTALSSTFNGTIAVTVVEVRPNGTAVVRGEKRMLLSQGQEWIQFSGIVRLADIDLDNNVLSGKVADARIEYAGNGAITRASREGWLSRFFNLITPF